MSPKTKNKIKDKVNITFNSLITKECSHCKAHRLITEFQMIDSNGYMVERPVCNECFSNRLEC